MSIDTEHCHGNCDSTDDEYDPAWCVCCPCCCQCLGCEYGPRDGMLMVPQPAAEEATR